MRTALMVIILAAVIIAGFYFVPRWMGDEEPTEGVPPNNSKTSAEVEKAAALLRQARAAARTGESAKARLLYEQVAADFPQTWAGREGNLELGNIYIKEGQKKEALEALKKGLPNVGEDQRESIMETIRHLERELSGKPVEPPEVDRADTVYVVRRNDTLGSIARKYRVPVELVKLANSRTNDLIRIGDLVRITRSMPTLKVSKKHLRLRLHFKGALVREYPVGIGKDNLTPAGEFTVGNKVKNPDWYRPGGGRIPYGDPRNILGTRWLTLISEDGVQRGYGIHGTTVPQSVPGQTSAGCIRMLNPNVDELYEWIPTGTKVLITDD